MISDVTKRTGVSSGLVVERANVMKHCDLWNETDCVWTVSCGFHDLEIQSRCQNDVVDGAVVIETRMGFLMENGLATLMVDDLCVGRMERRNRIHASTVVHGTVQDCVVLVVTDVYQSLDHHLHHRVRHHPLFLLCCARNVPSVSRLVVLVLVCFPVLSVVAFVRLSCPLRSIYSVVSTCTRHYILVDRNAPFPV